jgi:hypothetical protein
MELVRFIFVDHESAALEAALLFGAGSLLAYPAVRLKLRSLTMFPLALFRLARCLVGTEANPRMALAIFGFNGTAMFLYMASGFHPAIPAAISLLTGFNIATILLWAGMDETRQDDEPIAPPGRWMPGRRLATVCGLAVLLIELPCFAFAIAMGIRMGQDVLSGRMTYAQGFASRVEAYASVILPLLLVSAICETVAIRGMSGGIAGGGKAPGA